MKKTLERLQKRAITGVQAYNQLRRETEGKQTDSFTTNTIISAADFAIDSIIDYANALEDAYSELAEPLDKKLEKMEKAIQAIDKPVEKKEKKSKTPYID